MMKTKLPNFRTGLVKVGSIKLDSGKKMAVYSSERSYAIARGQRCYAVDESDEHVILNGKEYVNGQATWYLLSIDERMNGSVKMPDGESGAFNFY